MSSFFRRLGGRGLAGMPGVHCAADLVRFARDAVAECRLLADRARAAAPTVSLLYDFDDVSRTFCAAADPIDAMRQLHCDPSFVEAAHEAHAELFAFVADLNADGALYAPLEELRRRADAGEPIPLGERSATRAAQRQPGTLTSEERHVLDEFLRDFLLGGAHLARPQRDALVARLSEHENLGISFCAHAAESSLLVELSESDLGGVPAVPTRAGSRPGTVRVSTDYANTLLLWLQNSATRERVHRAALSRSAENIDVLHRLRAVRQEIADTLGYASYTDLTVAGNMLNKAQDIEQLLRSVQDHIRGRCMKELAVLRREKEEFEGSATIHAWDSLFYMGRGKAGAFQLDGRVLADFFPLERCVKGLYFICERLYGLKIRRVRVSQSEIWAPDVQKYRVCDASGAVVGNLYLDLFQRPYKRCGDAHLTLRCGVVRDGELEDVPTVALAFGFTPRATDEPILLSHSEVQTLFHEFGHAMHSILGASPFQFTAGTRCAQDIVEVPSTLMEYYAWDPKMLRKFAKHHRTNEPLPRSLSDRLSQSRFMFSGLELESQLFYNHADQYLCGAGPYVKDYPELFDALGAMDRDISSIPSPERPFAMARFTHAIGYAGQYYSYMWSKAIASDLWNRHFADDPLSREAGEHYRASMLSRGGSEPPRQMVERVLGGPVDLSPMLDAFANGSVRVCFYCIAQGRLYEGASACCVLEGKEGRGGRALHEYDGSCKGVRERERERERERASGITRKSDVFPLVRLAHEGAVKVSTLSLSLSLSFFIHLGVCACWNT